jgi:hypothetical protein
MYGTLHHRLNELAATVMSGQFVQDRYFGRLLGCETGRGAAESRRTKLSTNTKEDAVRFVILRKADKNTEAGAMPTKDVLQAMSDYMEQMGKAGILRGAEGFHPSSKGARVRFLKGTATVVNGPFSPPTDLVAGFCIIDVTSRDEALNWAKRWPSIDASGNAELEVLQVHEADDFGEVFTPELREKEENLREQIAGRK